MEGIKKRLAEDCKLIDERIRELLAGLKVENPQRIRQDLIGRLEEFSLRGGKRIRGHLVLQSYRMFGGEELDKAIDVASAIELMHAFLLIHDDIMDSSITRRGDKTLHKIYDDDHPGHGVNLGLAAGDTLLFFAYRIIEDAELLRMLSGVLLDTCFGQVTEYLSNVENNIDEERILEIYEMKTSRYSLLMPLLAGAMLAGTKETGKLADFAIPLGIAYQIQDDLLDYSDSSGKDKYSDIREGKMTLVMYRAYEGADQEQKAFLDSVFGKDELDGEKLERILYDTGAFDHCRRMIQELAQESSDAIEEMPEHQKEILSGIKDLLMQRKN